MSKNKQIISLVIFFIIAQGGVLFLGNAVYWDDWTVFNLNPDVLLEQFRQSGDLFGSIGHLHLFLMQIGPWLYKVATFSFSFVTGLCLWKIAKKQNWINSDQAYYIALFFLITPCMAARAAVINLPYILCVFMFYFAWLVMERKRIWALLLFSMSFTTPSLLVFYALPILNWCLNDIKKITIKTLVRWGISKIDFLIIPFIVFYIKIAYFKPYGDFIGYNENFSLRGLGVAFTCMVMDFMQLNVNLFAVVAITAAVLYVNILPSVQFLTARIKLLFAGFLALVTGLFPYLILGLVPSFTEWTTRHQLLMPLGLSLLFVWFVGLLKVEYYKKIVIAFIIALSLVINVKNYWALFWDWQKEKAFITFIRNNPIPKGSLVIIHDETSNGLSRSYRKFEWAAMMKLASNGDESRYGLYEKELSDYELGKFDTLFISRYSSASHIRNKGTKRRWVTIEQSPYNQVLFHHQPVYVLAMKSKLECQHCSE